MTSPHLCYNACYQRHANEIDKMLDRMELTEDDATYYDLRDSILRMCDENPDRTDWIDSAKGAGLPV